MQINMSLEKHLQKILDEAANVDGLLRLMDAECMVCFTISLHDLH
jgi:hypothetical protein